jgi:WD40 repeat protein/serine/threonine protein kinase
MTSATHSAFDNLAGQTLRGYEVRDLIGSGGFAAVYRAFQPVVQRDVAIKVILSQHANNPDFIRRFEYEAQVVARLEHPYIVPLYDFWREPNAAVLVMRWLPGGSVADALRKGPLAPGVVARYLDQIAPALDMAHRRGVVHRDLKAGNILIDEENNAYLADFGIAKDTINPTNITESGVLIGSPSYLSPEQIQGIGVGVAADIYSLGVVVYEMLTGYLPFAATSIVELIYKHMHESLPPLSKYRPNLPDKLDAVLAAATEKKPADRLPSATAFAMAFRQAISTLLPSADTGNGQGAAITEPAPAWSTTTPASFENPYKGLRAFQEDDSQDFFGRSHLIKQLIQRMTEPEWGGRFLAVIGPSGSGKSSVVRAGVIPELRKGTIPGSESWFIVDMLPSAYPYEELERALLRVSPIPIPDLTERLRNSDMGLLDVVAKMLPADRSEVLLVVDQFEELFTLVNEEAVRASFLAMLLKAVTTFGSRLRVLITLRADFYDKPLLYQTFGELIKKRTEVVLPLGTQELHLAIVGPAHRVGLIVVPELVEAMIHDVGEQAGALPLLQYALTELYERRHGSMMSLTGYLQSGGVMGALARRADELYQSLDPTQQEAARQLFLRLVTLGEGTEDTRRRVRATEVMTTPEQNKAVDRVIDIFARFRLLTLDRDPITRGPTIEVAHEALIRSWTRLRGWLSDSREELKTQRRLSQTAADWDNSNREESFLATGTRLEQFDAWKSITTLRLSQEEKEYLDESLKLRERRQAEEQARRSHEERTARLAQTFQRAAVLLAIIGAVALIATLAAITQASQAQARAATSQAEVVQAGTELEKLVTTLTPIPLTLTYAADRVDEQQRRVNALRLASDAEAVLQRPGSDPLTAVLLAVRSLKLQYTSEADTVLTRALAASERVRIFSSELDGVQSMALSPDGNIVATGTWFTDLRLWDAETGREIRKLEGHGEAVAALAFSPDGQWLASGSYDDTVRIWRVENGELIHDLAGHTGDLSSVEFSHDGKYVLSASSDGTFRIWDVQAGTTASEVNVSNTHHLTGAAFSPNDTLVVTAGGDSMVRVWDWTQENAPLRMETNAQTGETNNPQFLPDGETVVVGTTDGSIRLYEVATGRELRRMKANDEWIYSVQQSRDGSRLITGGLDRLIHIWDTASGQPLRVISGHGGNISGALLSSDEMALFSISNDRTLRCWNLQPSVDRRVLVGHDKEVYTTTFSPDGKLILSGSNDRTLRLWDVATGQTLRVYEGHTDSVTSGIFSPDGSRVMSSATDGTLRIWDTATGQQLQQVDYPDGAAVYTLMLSPDGKLIGTTSTDKTARLWDATTFAPIRTFEGHTNEVYGLMFTQDSKRFVTSSADGTVRVWDAATGKEIRRLDASKEAVRGVSLTPDDKYVLTSGDDFLIRQWDIETGREIRQFTGHGDSVAFVGVSPDGRLLISASDDRHVRLWDMESGELVRELGGVNDAVSAVVFSPDGRLMAGSIWDGTVHLWNTSLSDFLADACASAPRDFTEIERSQYQLDSEPTCPQFGAQTNPNPPTSTPVAIVTLPVWTPMASPTLPPPPTYTPTATPTPLSGLFVTFTPAPATPAP